MAEMVFLNSKRLIYSLEIDVFEIVSSGFEIEN